MKILVTGGAGFIGSEFIRQGVDKGLDLCVIDNLAYAGDLERIKDVKNRIRFFKADIADKNSMEKIFEEEKPDTVVHWAAESHVDRSILDASPFIDTNVRGTQVVLDAARKTGLEKFINISTDEVYGELGEEGQFYENTPLDPNSPYSVSKASADMMGRAYYHTYGLPVITVRPSNNYGAWQYPEKLIPVVILKALNNEKIPVYGQGLNVREWLYVSDCAQAVYALIEKGNKGEIYNTGSGQEKRNIDVVKAILNILDRPESLIEFVKDRLGHDFRYSLNTGKINKEVGWSAQVKFEEGISKTVSWYVENIKWVEQKLDFLKEYWKKVY
ncbi:MAG: dTDP-glucose 4,6-dehydratase [bacterium]|nr:dTDP-glucose 4,6-dehydratase [bacterium]